MARKKTQSADKERSVSADELFATGLSDLGKLELEKLAALDDSEIDYSDAPPIEVMPKEVYVGRFYRNCQRV